MADRKCPVCGKRSMEEHGTNPGDRHYWFCRNCGSQLFDKPQDWLNGQRLYDGWANSCVSGCVSGCVRQRKGECNGSADF